MTSNTEFIEMLKDPEFFHAVGVAIWSNAGGVMINGALFKLPLSEMFFDEDDEEIGMELSIELLCENFKFIKWLESLIEMEEEWNRIQYEMSTWEGKKNMIEGMTGESMDEFENEDDVKEFFTVELIRSLHPDAPPYTQEQLDELAEFVIDNVINKRERENENE